MSRVVFEMVEQTLIQLKIKVLFKSVRNYREALSIPNPPRSECVFLNSTFEALFLHLLKCGSGVSV